MFVIVDTTGLSHVGVWFFLEQWRSVYCDA